MVNTKTITPIKLKVLGWAALGGMLSCFAAANLFATATPAGQLNERIAADLVRADSLATKPRLELLGELRTQQEQALAREPGDPIAWQRLAYLRLITQGDMPDAFAALRVSDLISPGEPEILPERAWLWYRLRGVESDDQQHYQDTLWRKAFDTDRDATWKLAVKMNMIDEAGASLQRADPALHEEWKERIRDMKH